MVVEASPADTFFALANTASLQRWFTEYADVSLPERRYDFWGRFTPGVPDREQGRHRLLAVEPEQRLAFAWRLDDVDTSVTLALLPRHQQTLVVVRHDRISASHDIGSATMEDFWFLQLENLRRHLWGKGEVVRCDFSAIRPGDITHTITIDAPRSEVFAALIRPDQLERWIASQATVDPVVGGRYDFGWSGAGPVKILDLVPDERLVTLWTEEPEIVVTWTLAESGGRTRLTIVHSGFAPDQPTGGLNAGWLNFMSWIKSMVEIGPAWRPPVIRLSETARPYYAAAIGAAQAELVGLDAVGPYSKVQQ